MGSTVAGGCRISAINPSFRTGKEDPPDRLTRHDTHARSLNLRAEFPNKNLTFMVQSAHKCSHLIFVIIHYSCAVCVLTMVSPKITLKLYLKTKTKKNEIKNDFNCFHLPRVDLSRSNPNHTNSENRSSEAALVG